MRNNRVLANAAEFGGDIVIANTSTGPWQSWTPSERGQYKTADVRAQTDQHFQPIDSPWDGMEAHVGRTREEWDFVYDHNTNKTSVCAKRETTHASRGPSRWWDHNQWQQSASSSSSTRDDDRRQWSSRPAQGRQVKDWDRDKKNW